MIYLKYLNYLLKHKWNVLIECWRIGLIWHGISHDMSKFRPSEFFPYANYFFGEKNEENKIKFGKAWELHKKRNPHHWDSPQHSTTSVKLYGETSKDLVTMDSYHIDQMLCDWRAMSKMNNNTVEEYFNANRHRIHLNKSTLDYLELFIKN